VATVLYTALANLTVSSAVATWFAHPQDVLPLDPLKPSTIALLAAGLIELAPDGASDTVTPANVVRGQAGIKTAVSN
jgi:hypothetical protein